MGVSLSVITATYNCASTIEDCLSSIAEQTYRNIEHVVIDGASSDGTLEILKRQRAAMSHFVSEPDGGIYPALNKGLALASGDVVGFLHADDRYASPDVLARVAAAFDDPDVVAVYGDLVYVHRDAPDRVLRFWRAGPYSTSRLRWGWMPPHPTLYLRRSAYEQWGTFDVGLDIAADYDFMLRVLPGLVGRVVYLPHILVRMRAGGVSNRSLSHVLRKSRQDYDAIARNTTGGLSVLFAKNIRKIPQFWQRLR